jgi:hypothetical protein
VQVNPGGAPPDLSAHSSGPEQTSSSKRHSRKRVAVEPELLRLAVSTRGIADEGKPLIVMTLSFSEPSLTRSVSHDAKSMM